MNVNIISMQFIYISYLIFFYIHLLMKVFIKLKYLLKLLKEK